LIKKRKGKIFDFPREKYSKISTDANVRKRVSTGFAGKYRNKSGPVARPGLNITLLALLTSSRLFKELANNGQVIPFHQLQPPSIANQQQHYNGSNSTDSIDSYLSEIQALKSRLKNFEEEKEFYFSKIKELQVCHGRLWDRLDCLSSVLVWKKRRKT
jgi:hypothetical protein